MNKYICPNGHSNDEGNEYCNTYNCHQNIKGLTKDRVLDINSFKIKVEALSSLFDKNQEFKIWA